MIYCEATLVLSICIGFQKVQPLKGLLAVVTCAGYRGYTHTTAPYATCLNHGVPTSYGRLLVPSTVPYYYLFSVLPHPLILHV